MITLLMGLSANAEETGTCGPNLKWKLTDDGVLTITGTGQMEDYNDTYKENPWYDKNVKQVIIADGVTTIGKDAFKECTKLTSINIPNSVTAIGYMAFYRCEALKSINIPNGVTIIGYQTFSGCYKLKQVDIPNSVTTLCEGLLKSCSSLESIRIHKDVVEIEESVFDGCTKLTNISCEATTPPTCGTDAFKSVDKSNCKLFVPQASVDAYKIANEWKDFSYIEAATGITNNVYNKTELVDVYTIDGTKRLSKASKEEMNTLPKGVYIVNGKKLVIK